MFEQVAEQRIVRVPEPPDQSSNAGDREAAANRGRILWVTILGKTSKVTGCRAPPAVLISNLLLAFAGMSRSLYLSFRGG